MFGELSKLFDRDFAISYVLPALGFVAANAGLRREFTLLPDWLTLTSSRLLGDSALLGLVALILAMLLSALNRETIVFFEGYGSFNPFRIIGIFEKQRFQRLRARKQVVDKNYSPLFHQREEAGKECQFLQDTRPEILRSLREYKKLLKLTQNSKKIATPVAPVAPALIAETEAPPDPQAEIDKLHEKLCRLKALRKQLHLTAHLRDERNEINETLALRFPDEERFLLPTAFGNTIRAFEVYPRVMYGFEGIEGWPRLVAVIPDNFQKLVNSAKAQTDFWVNVWMLSLLFTIEYLVTVGLKAHAQPNLSFFRAFLNVFQSYEDSAILGCVSFALIFLAAQRAQTASVQWGYWVKSAFDNFLPSLTQKLALPLPTTIEQEREQWTGFSRAIRFHLPEQIVSRNYSVLPAPKDTSSAKEKAED